MSGRENYGRIKEYAKIPTERLLKYKGLNKDEVENLRNKYGANINRKSKKDTVPFRLRRAFINPFSAVLFVIALISLFVDIIFAAPGERNFTTFGIILTMLFVSGCVRFTQELKAKRITDGLLKFSDSKVTVKRDGLWTKTGTDELVVGDLIKLVAGERVPADIRIVKAKDCFVSESAVTGESALQEKFAREIVGETEKAGDFTDTAFCGTTVINGFAEGIVFAVGENTFYGQIALDNIAEKRAYNRGTNATARVLIRFMAVLVPLVFIVSGLTKGNWVSAFLFSLSVAVGLTPELLPMVITACLAKGSFNMSRKQTVVKNVNAMQAFGSMDVICIDKTGTLTEDTQLLEYYTDILGNESREVLDCAYLNCFYHSGIYNRLDFAVLKVRQMPGRAEYYDELTRRYEKQDELPFDYTRKMSSVLLKSLNKSVIISKGNVDDVLKHCAFAFYKGEKIPVDETALKSVHTITDEMSKDGMKVLAVAAKFTDAKEISPSDERDLTLLGYLAFFDAPKKTAKSAINKLKELNVAAKVLTGDNRDVAVSVCRRLGMDADSVMTGSELDGLSDNDVQIKVEETQIFAQLSPAQKAYIVKVLQSNGHTVGFLADGINDLPAVLKADVGISVDTAVPCVKESADVILLKKDLNVPASGIKEGRRAFANMSKYVKITASSNLGNIIAVVFAGIFLPFFPMTSVQLLLLNLLYDVLCLVLPWDNVDSKIYRKPLEQSGKTLTGFMLTFGPVSSIFDIITFVFLYGFLCPSICGGMYESLSAAAQLQFISVFQTGWFLESMWTQVLIIHLLRTDRLLFFRDKPSVPVTAVTLSGIAAFTLLALTPAGGIIGLTPLPPIYFAFLTVNVLCYLAAVTFAKRIYIRHYHGLI